MQVENRSADIFREKIPALRFIHENIGIKRTNKFKSSSDEDL